MKTLNIDAELLRKAELRARYLNINLSEAIEAFIHQFIEQPVKKEEIKITPFVERLGVDLDLPADFDEKEAYRKHLEEKCCYPVGM